MPGRLPSGDDYVAQLALVVAAAQLRLGWSRCWLGQLGRR